MTAKIIDGKAFAQKIRDNIQRISAELYEKKGIRPGLAVILIGDDPASAIYVRNKDIQAREVGFYSEIHHLSADTTQEQLLHLITSLNKKPSIHGILVQLPLPLHLNKDNILSAILPEKDVDGFHPENVGKLWNNTLSSVPCTPLGCSLILREYVGTDLSGKHAVMIGASNIVGRPMTAVLLRMNATVTIAHSHSKNIAVLARQADILIVATGNPGLVKKDWVKHGAVVMDIGINRVEIDGEQKIVGDVEFDSVKEVASVITPVPGGIGPVTVACLLQNTIDLMYLQLEKSAQSSP